MPVDSSNARTGATPSWRDQLPIHPAAELFPRMSEAELRALGEDIRRTGITSPIVLWRDAAQVFLLDGVSRLDAIEMMAGGITLVPPSRGRKWSIEASDRRFCLGSAMIETSAFATPFTSGIPDPFAYVISANIHRRHLSAEQRRDLIAKLIKATPEKSDRQIAATVRASPTTVGTVRAEMESKGDVSTLDTRTDSRGRQQSAHRAPSAAKSGKTGNKGEPVLDLKAQPTPTRDDIGHDSGSEIERLRARVDELTADKRRLEIKITGLESEIAELREPASATRCQICREKKPATRRSVCVCDFCAGIHELPRADDGLDIPPKLRRPAS